MKRSVLFVGYDSPVEKEIGDYIRDIASEVFFGSTHEQAIRILNDHAIESVVLNLRSMNDAVILRYINRYHPDIHVVISANREFEENIEVLTEPSYAHLPQPLSLEKLMGVL